MNRDDVLKMAIDAGWSVPSQWDETDGFLMRLERFAALVAAHEREQCAKVCLDEAPTLDGQLCAAAIRARGES